MPKPKLTLVPRPVSVRPDGLVSETFADGSQIIVDDNGITLIEEKARYYWGYLTLVPDTGKLLKKPDCKD